MLVQKRIEWLELYLSSPKGGKVDCAHVHTQLQLRKRTMYRKDEAFPRHSPENEPGNNVRLSVSQAYLHDSGLTTCGLANEQVFQRRPCELDKHSTTRRAAKIDVTAAPVEFKGTSVIH